MAFGTTEWIIAGVAIAGATGLTYALTRLRFSKESSQLLSEKEVALALSKQAALEADILKASIVALQSENGTLQRDNARLQEAQQQLEKALQEKQAVQEESLKIAKVAMFESGTEIFRKEAEGMRQQTFEQLQKLSEKVSTISSQVQKQDRTVDILWKSLSSPGSAGEFSEIGLENTLKNYGLESGRDYITQFHIARSMGATDGNLRPDAVVFLPGNDVLVIDSKASKAFLELAEAIGTPQEAAVQEVIRKRMQEHIKGLAGKGYRDAIKKAYMDAGKGSQIGHIRTILFLHTEAHVERLYHIDPQMHQKSIQQDIIISGPAGLASILSGARYTLSSERQQAHHETIVHEISQLLGGLRILAEHTQAVGKAIASAARHYQKLTSSLNASFLPKANKVTSLGIALPQNKELPKRLPGLQVMEESITIEGTVETESAEQ